MYKRLGSDSVKHELHQNYKAVLTTQGKILRISVCNSTLMVWCVFLFCYVCDKRLLYSTLEFNQSSKKASILKKTQNNRSDLNISSYGRWSLAYYNFSWNRKLIILIENQAKHTIHIFHNFDVKCDLSLLILDYVFQSVNVCCLGSLSLCAS